MKQRKRRIMAILLVFAMLFTMVDPSMFGGVITAQAEESNTSLANVTSGWVGDTNTYNILSEGDLLAVSIACNAKSGYEKYLSANYVLYDNLEFKEEHHNQINIGSSSRHFTGTFDGQGYTITGLWGDAQTAVNNGLFGVMEGATVKNLVIKNADYRSNQYGGILAAQAENSVIQNVTIIDSSCKVASLGAVVGLITTGGLYGGALVGYAGNTKIYNCESRNTSVYVDTTGGVQALGGDGMYMGGLVGWIDDGGILEYSRVVGGTVSTEYYVAVGALAANNLYAGGLVGRIDGSDETTVTQVLDCFSSAKVNYAGECYVSVGAGLSGYAGGVAARISGSNYKMERCHYAGNIHGHLLNSILVLPIIAMEDYYLGGVAGNVEDSSKIQYCYFNWENATKDNKYPGGPKMPAISGESNTGDVTTIGSAQYSNTTFFETFDFEGTEGRETGNAAPFDGEHKNKWVIDPVNNMPIHGKRVEATMDFPGAGTITFAETSIYDATSTSTNESNISQIAQVYEGMNEALTLTATVNEGYNFKGWYKDGALVAGAEKSTLTLGGDDGLSYEDNEVYEAKYTANVVFKEMNNGVDKTKEYTYNQELNPEDATLSEDGYVFLGWSEDVSKDFLNPESSYYRSEIKSSDLKDIEFIEEDFPVTRPMTVYPVFIKIENYNIQVQMESAPQKENTSDYIKEVTGNEGTAEVKTDENGDLFITVAEDDSVKDSDEYRFDGWYELELNDDGSVKVDDTGKPIATRVSKSRTFYLENVDLDIAHRYEARYQYGVTTWIPIKTTDTTLHFQYGIPGSEYCTYYMNYGDDATDLPKPGLNIKNATFSHWRKAANEEETENRIELTKKYSRSEMNDLADKKVDGATIQIKEPMNLYAVIEVPTIGTYYPVTVKSDFPTGITNAEMLDGGLWLSDLDPRFIKAAITIKDGYNFKGFYEYYLKEGNSDDEWEIQDKTQTFDETSTDETTKTTTGSWRSNVGYYPGGETLLLARLTANVNFHKYNEDTVVVERKYNSKLFNHRTDGSSFETQNWDEWSEDNEHLSTPISATMGEEPVGIEETPTNEEMHRDGYEFVGWTTETEIFQDFSDFTVADRTTANSYKLDVDNVKVIETMDIYPMYLKYNVEIKTNFNEAASKPIVEIVQFTEDGTVEFKFTGDGYEFAPPSEWTVKVDGIEATDVNITFDEETAVYTITGLKTETEYEIIASCTATVTFNDGDSVETKQYDYNQELGELPTPTKEINDQETSIGVNESIGDGVNVFVGWNTGGDSEYVTEENKVTGPMTLEPVYTTPDLNLKSDLEDSGATITVSKTGEVTLKAPEKDGYDFAGWKWSGKESETITVEANEDGTYVYELTPEEAREGGTYTAKYNPIVTYTIPKVENDTLTEGEPVTGSVPYGSIMGDVIDLTIVEVTNKIVEALKGTDYVFEGEWSKDGWTGKKYEDPVTEPITLYPIITIKKEEQVTIYSNIDENSGTVVELERENGKVTFPEVEKLGDIVKEGPKGINDESVETKFVGYSLVFIVNNTDGTEISRVSDALYAPGDTIDAEEITAYNDNPDKEDDPDKEGGEQIARIYAVWTQIQTIPGARIYLGDEYKHGMLTVAAINTKILKTAGLQEVDSDQTAGKSSYGRYFEYIKDGQTNYPLTGDCGTEIWDNKLYAQYFSNEELPNGWDIIASVLYNLKAIHYKSKLAAQPYLTFDYKDGENTRVNGDSLIYSYDSGARNMLDADKDGTWLWKLSTEEKEELAKYASYNSYNEYLEDTKTN